MAKKNNRSGKRSLPPPRTPPIKSVTEKNTIEKIKDAHQEVWSIATEKDIEALTTDPQPENISPDKLWEIVREARDLYNAVKERLNKETEGIKLDRSTLETRNRDLDEKERIQRDKEKELNGQQEQFEIRIQIIEDREKELEKKEHGLLDCQNELSRRELNAEAGFIAERKQVSEIFDAAIEQYREELKKLLEQIANQRANWLQECIAESERLHCEVKHHFGMREQELIEQETNLNARRGELRCRELELGVAEQELAEARANLDELVEQRLAAQTERDRHKIQSLESQLEQVREDRNFMEDQLRERENIDRRFGQSTPDQVLAQLNRLNQQNQELQAELATRLDKQSGIRLQQLEAEREQWQTDHAEFQRKESELMQRLARIQLGHVEIEMLRDQKAAAESRIAVLKRAHEELRTEVDGLIGRNEAKRPFPACSGMDSDPVLQTPRPMVDDTGDLKDLILDIQQRIAYDPQYHDRRLYYSLEDLRCFLGGLAMGKIILLQGISGTGKTSLPVAFARAIGTKETCTLIEVQAGWRDPQDLMGHYNAFEKKFYEQKFLKALYLAQTPRWKDSIHIIVMDEMNLSHPEQYFSDILSKLEELPEKRLIELMTHSVEFAPDLFKEGNKLLLPENVWFVGTANHDETTKDFADKTYDRSLIMEFPHRPEPFEVKPPQRRDAISYMALQNAFEDSKQRHQDAVQKVSEFLNQEARDLLGKYFEIGWGPRLNKQLESFVPVVIAAGGTVAEATDHMLAMRLLRKLKNRHDNQVKHLEMLRERILEKWSHLGTGPKPVKSNLVLRAELHRIGYPVEDDL